MAQLSFTFCRLLAQSRRAKQMTQCALAQAVGCKQSAISMLESGQSAKIALETVNKIANLLDVPLEHPSSAASMASVVSSDLPETVSQRYCPNARCYSNVPYVINGELLFWPCQPHYLHDAQTTYCTVCGELLEQYCPHCGAARCDGACCSLCGGARVTNTIPAETDYKAWAIKRRNEISAWRTLAWGGK